MAELMQFNQNTTDPPEFSRPLIEQRKIPDVANLKKRKLLVGIAEELGLPAPKHKCYEAISGSEFNFLPVNGLGEEDDSTLMKDGSDVVNEQHAQGNSAQGSNSIPGDMQSESSEVKLDLSSEYADSYDDASTSWANSGYGRSQSCSFHADSSIRDRNVEDEEQFLQQDTSWHEIDSLEECTSAHYSVDNSEQTADGLKEFLSSTGVDPNLYPLSAGRWDVEQETQLEKQKPTIDQEFEQYFSMLML